MTVRGVSDVEAMKIEVAGCVFGQQHMFSRHEGSSPLGHVKTLRMMVMYELISTYLRPLFHMLPERISKSLHDRVWPTLPTHPTSLCLHRRASG